MVVQPTLKTLQPSFKSYLNDLLTEVKREGERMVEFNDIAICGLEGDVELGISEWETSDNEAVNFVKVAEEER